MTRAEVTAEVTAEVPARMAVAFVGRLRGAGVAVPGGASTEYALALAAVGLHRRDHVYWAGRATLVRRPDDIAAYDAAFDDFWRAGAERTGAPEPPAAQPAGPDPDGPALDPAGSTPSGAAGGRRREAPGPAGGPGDDEGPAAAGAEQLVALARYTPLEVLRAKDFAACTEEELDRVHRLLASLRFAGVRRPCRRRRPARRGDRVDLRRTVRNALGTEGEALRRSWSATGTRPRRLVFVCDVSGSMAPYARAMLHFVHAAEACHPLVEAFTIGTRLTRVTAALAHRDPDTALERAAGDVRDWSGGTRLGPSLAELVERHGSGAMLRGAVVVVLSDGWDRGDTAVLADAMRRLHLLAHRLVWVNPWKASPGFAPVARGMAAALPYVDELVEGHSFSSLETLAGTVLR